MAVYVGIDPGKSGGICVYDTTMHVISFRKMPDTIHGVVDRLRSIKEVCSESNTDVKVVLEKVHSMPGQGVASTFTFGQGYGQLQGVIAALGLACVEVIPNRWMKCIGTMPKDKADRKKFIKDWVEKRSGESIPLYVADAVAIAYVAPTIWGGK